MQDIQHMEGRSPLEAATLVPALCPAEQRGFQLFMRQRNVVDALCTEFTPTSVHAVLEAICSVRKTVTSGATLS
jgi:hypothetical protein